MNDLKADNEQTTSRATIEHGHGTNCIFQQPWWLEAVAPGQWDAVEIFRGGQLVARLPYVVKRRYGFKVLTMPQLTQTLGPWLPISDAKYAERIGCQKDLMTELIEKLPRHDFFLQNFHYSVDNWMPFYWRGFSQTTRYTYVAESLGDTDELWTGFRGQVRTSIRKAEKKVVVREDLELEKFIDINELTFRRQNKSLPYSRDLVRRIDAACAARQARRIFFAEDARGRIHAAAYLVWDRSSAVFLMNGGDPELRSSGANNLIMWRALQFASTVTNAFNFEGSMNERIELFYRGFGGRLMPYSCVSRASRRLRALLSGQELVGAVLGHPSAGTVR